MKKVKTCVCKVVIETIEIELSEEEIENYMYGSEVDSELVEEKYNNNEFELVDTDEGTYYFNEGTKHNFLEHDFEFYIA